MWERLHRSSSFCLFFNTQDALETDKQSRTEREMQIAKRLGELEYRTEGKFEAEKVGKQKLRVRPFSHKQRTGGEG